MVADEGNVKIELFNGENFKFWKMQIEDYLYMKNLYLPLEGKKPENMTDAEWNHLDRKALAVIRLTLSDNVFFNIAKEKTTAGLMDILTNLYEKPATVKKVHLMQKLFNLKMVEGGSVADHLNKFNMVTTELSSVSIEFEDEIRALILLSSLSESWNNTVIAVSNSYGKSILKYDDVCDLILNEEIRWRELGKTSRSALSRGTRGRTNDRNSDRGRAKSMQRSKSKGVTCWNCGNKGHIKKDCNAPKKSNNR